MQQNTDLTKSPFDDACVSLRDKAGIMRLFERYDFRDPMGFKLTMCIPFVDMVNAYCDATPREGYECRPIDRIWPHARELQSASSFHKAEPCNTADKPMQGPQP